jgi:heat shock 70kDa protein 4
MDIEYEWLYGDGAKTTKKQYADRYDKLFALCNPA